MAIHKNYAPLSLGVTEARTVLVKAIEEAKNQPIALIVAACFRNESGSLSSVKTGSN
jgi:hypothetical protein